MARIDRFKKSLMKYEGQGYQDMLYDARQIRRRGGAQNAEERAILAELERRRKLGMIRKNAGVERKEKLKSKIYGYNLGNVDKEVNKLLRGF